MFSKIVGGVILATSTTAWFYSQLVYFSLVPGFRTIYMTSSDWPNSAPHYMLNPNMVPLALAILAGIGIGALIGLPSRVLEGSPMQFCE